MISPVVSPMHKYGMGDNLFSGGVLCMSSDFELFMQVDIKVEH
jgi:hypothetical protein